MKISFVLIKNQDLSRLLKSFVFLPWAGSKTPFSSPFRGLQITANKESRNKQKQGKSKGFKQEKTWWNLWLVKKKPILQALYVEIMYICGKTPPPQALNYALKFLAMHIWWLWRLNSSGCEYICARRLVIASKDIC